MQQYAPITYLVFACGLPCLSFLASTAPHTACQIQGSRTPCISYQSQGKTSNAAMASWYWSCQGKYNTVKHWMGQCFAHKEKRQRKISSSSMCQSLVASRALPLPVMDSWSVCTPLIAAEGPRPESCGTTQGCWQRYLSRTKEHLLSLRQGKIFPYKVINQA